MFIGENADGTVTEIESRDVTFLENDFSKVGEIDRDLHLYEMMDPEIIPSVEKRTLHESSGSGQVPEMSTMEEPMLRKSSRQSIPRQRFEIEGEIHLVIQHDENESKSVNEALTCLEKNEWMKAMEEEMESLKENQVWDLVDLPSNRKAIGNKWVLKIKRKADGSIERYKARLVAKGYTQLEGIDYEVTFSPVVKFASIRLILSLVAHFDLELHQMDVKTTFLNGELNEEIYMEKPIGFVIQSQEHKVCKLNRSIYGLKQSSRQWYWKFHNEITLCDFTMIDEDHCVYVK